MGGWREAWRAVVPALISLGLRLTPPPPKSPATLSQQDLCHPAHVHRACSEHLQHLTQWDLALAGTAVAGEARRSANANAKSAQLCRVLGQTLSCSRSALSRVSTTELRAGEKTWMAGRGGTMRSDQIWVIHTLWVLVAIGRQLKLPTS